MNKAAIYPGTFDPITFGHIDVIKKGLKLFDKIIVVDSGSKDDTKEICEKYNIDFFYRDFDGFGNQWNYLLGLIDEGNLFVKMDPDERYNLKFLKILNKI